VLRALKGELRRGSRQWERLRQLWLQGDLFDSAGGRDTGRGQELDDLRVRPAPRPVRGGTAKVRRPPRTHRDDLPYLEEIRLVYGRYNAQHFGGRLRPVLLRVSRRMKNRLGHYMAATATLPAEIAISRRHIRRDGWDDVLHTLLHEMVHQWQDEHGHAVDHGGSFRAKAREVGISARATRPAAPERRKSAARVEHA